MFSRANNGLALLMLLLCVKKGCHLLLAIMRQRLREALGLQVMQLTSNRAGLVIQLYFTSDFNI